MIIQQICCRQRRIATFPPSVSPFPSPIPLAAQHAVGIIFEVSGTLYDDTCWWRWMTQLVSHMGVHLEFEDFYCGWEARFVDDVCRGRDEFWHALRTYLLSRGLSRGMCDEILVAGQARHRHMERGIRPFAGVRETLAKLHARPITTVAVCNSPCATDQLTGKLNSMGLGAYFDFTITSLDLGYAMPAAAFFETVLTRNNLPAGGTVFVSSQASHLVAAHRAGMATIAFNHRGPVDADTCLERFADIPDAVRSDHARSMAA
jgi:FMN phosphatase YigB (HAD superfamily)